MTAYDLAFQISPIILVGGVVSGAQGGALPIIYFYGQLGLFSDVTDPTAFPRYLPVPGGTLISNQVGTYPFANQYVAANALIVQPLAISMRMISPVNQPGGYLTKLAMFSALQNSLAQHCALGGTFSVATPAYIYNNLLLTEMIDVTHGENQQQQVDWQLDFVQPLLTQQAAAAAQNNFFSKVTGGSSFSSTPSWSGNTNAQSPTVSSGLPGIIGNFGGL
jgi:hypothetical protein